jgi:hypothetical protein
MEGGMRSLVLLIPLVGCAQPTVDLDLKSVLATSTRGAAVHEGGRLADVAMADQICRVDIDSGAVLGDTDPTDQSERLLDARADALALSNGRLWTIPDDGQAAEVPLTVEPIDGRITDAGILALFTADDGTCGLALWDGASATGLGTGLVRCDGDVAFDVDATTGVAWITDGKGMVSVTPDGVVSEFDATVDTVEWDGADGLAVVAKKLDNWIVGVSADGSTAWTVEVDGELVDLSVADEEGLIVASVANDHGGEIVVLRGATGEQVVSHEVPDQPIVEFSPDGTALALEAPDAIYFYSVDPNASVLDTPTARQVDGAHGVAGGSALVGTAIAIVMIVD